MSIKPHTKALAGYPIKNRNASEYVCNVLYPKSGILVSQTRRTVHSIDWERDNNVYDNDLNGHALL